MKRIKSVKRNFSEKLKTSKAKAKFLEKGISEMLPEKGLFSPHTVIRDSEL